MKPLLLISLVIALSVQYCTTSNNEACMSVMRQLVGGGGGSRISRPTAAGLGLCTNCQSMPGKRGPVGPPGDRGPQGIEGMKGECSCDLSEVRRLREIVERQGELLQRAERVVEGLCYVGISSGTIPVTSFTASSTHPHCPLTNLPLNSRISWCALTSRIGEWVQVDFKSPRKITGVVTQGRVGANQYVTSYKVSYGVSLNDLRIYQDDGSDKIFKANNNAVTPVTNRFLTPITARYIRIYPTSHHRHMSMRIELLDC